MLSMQHTRLMLPLLLALSAACADDGAELDAPEEQAIRLGTVQDLPGLIEIRFADRLCSGVAVGPTVIATSASCFSNIAFDDFNTVQLKLRLNASDASSNKPWKCVTGAKADSDGRCTKGVSLTVTRMRPSGDEGNDFAVIVDPSASYAHVAGLYTGAIEVPFPVAIWGVGPGQWDGTEPGVARSLADTVDWAGGQHFVIDADNMRLCREGDEGAPALKDGRWLVGSFLRANDWSSSCAQVGAKQRFTRITTEKVNFINEALSDEGASERCRVQASGDVFDCSL